MKKLFLLLLFPAFCQAQTGPDIFNLSAIQKPIAGVNVAPAILSGMTSIVGLQGPSQSYTLQGTQIGSNNIIVTAPTNFLVSKDNSTFSSSVTVTPTGGNVTQTIYVAISASAPAGSVSGNVTNACTGFVTQNVAVSGTAFVSTINESGSLSAFTTTAGTASASQSFTFTGSNLSASVIWTAGTGMEISKDNTSFATTQTYTQSGGSASGTVYVRIAASTSAQTITGNISGTSTGASTVNVPYSATINPAPSLSVSPSSITGLNSTAGTAGTAQTVSVTFANISGNVTVTPPSPVEASSNGSSYGGAGTAITFPGSNSSPQTIYLRDAASASPGSVSGNVTFAASGVTTQNVSVAGTVSSAGNTDSMFVNLDTTELQSSGGGWVNLTGDPHLRTLSVVGGVSNNITITSSPTQGGNTAWWPYGGCGCSAYPDNGNTNATAGPAQVMKETWFSSNASNQDAFISGTFKWKFTGLNTSGTYTVVMFGTLNPAVFNFSSSTEYRVGSAAGISSPTTINNSVAPNGNISTIATFSGLTTTTGEIDLYMNGATGTEMATGTMIKLWRTN